MVPTFRWHQDLYLLAHQLFRPVAEDLVHGLQRAGRRTDIKLDTLVAVARDVAAFLGRDLPGCVYKIGAIA